MLMCVLITSSCPKVFAVGFEEGEVGCGGAEIGGGAGSSGTSVDNHLGFQLVGKRVELIVPPIPLHPSPPKPLLHFHTHRHVHTSSILLPQSTLAIRLNWCTAVTLLRPAPYVLEYSSPHNYMSHE